jgi:hypothetical protein
MTLSEVQASFDVKSIRASEGERRIEMRWGPAEKGSWYSDVSIENRLSRANYRAAHNIQMFFREHTRGRSSMYSTMFIPNSPISIEGLDNYSAVKAASVFYLLPGIPFVQYLLPLIQDREFDATARGYIYLQIIETILSPRAPDDAGKTSALDMLFRQMEATPLRDYFVGRGEFIDSVLASKVRLFDPFALLEERGSAEDWYA